MSDEKLIEKAWQKGPTAKLLDGSRFDIHYRWRIDEWSGWTEGVIGSTARTAEDACRRTVGMLSKRFPNRTVELVRCVDRGNEVEIQTGKSVKLVSDNDFQAIKDKVQEELEKHKNELDDMLYGDFSNRFSQ